MSTPTKATPAKAPATTKSGAPRKPRTTPPALDLASLSAADAPTPTITRGAGIPANIVSWVQESWSKRAPSASGTNVGSWKKVTVPDANADQVAGLIRRAADSLGCGVKFGNRVSENGNTVLVFAAKDKKKFTKK